MLYSPICNYGCKQEATTQLKNGKWCCEFLTNKCPAVRKKNKDKNNGRLKSQEHKQKIGNSNKGKIITKEQKLKMSNSMKGRRAWNKGIREVQKRSDEYREKMSIACKGKEVTEETKKRMSEHQKGEKAYWYGKHKSKESKEKCSNSMKKRFKDEDFLKKFYDSTNRKPNKPESALILLLDHLKINFVYVGNYKKWINGKNPDFINEDNKQIIEFFGDYYHGEDFRLKNHKDETINDEHEANRINFFKECGYDCLIIWEKDLKNIETLKEMILTFVNKERKEES